MNNAGIELIDVTQVLISRIEKLYNVVNTQQKTIDALVMVVKNHLDDHKNPTKQITKL